jgi:pimeloyl-ACP methyl ester carboxylesterase
MGHPRTRLKQADPQPVATHGNGLGPHGKGGGQRYGSASKRRRTARRRPVSEITVPALIRYGTSDVLVPPGHGDWLATHVPNSVVKVDDAGHLGHGPVAAIAEDGRWLRDGTPPA